MKIVPKIVPIIFLGLLTAFSVSAQQPPSTIPTVSSDNIARQGAFYVGGSYVGGAGEETMGGAMYVEVMVPKEIKYPYPIVLLHGTGQTGFDWLWTPDGRPGWAYNFIDMGFVVYLQDYPARGRSPYVPAVDGDLSIRTGPTLEKIFTAPADEDFPQAKDFTQWPGTGKMGDSIMDTFTRTQVQYIGASQAQLTIDANTALLDLIDGPVILLTHSQGGRFGWSIADERPDNIKAIVTVEPSSPPIRSVDPAKVAYRESGGLAWGVGNVPITYDPPISEASELQVELQPEAEGENLIACYRQTEPARTLPNLQDIPVLFLNGQGGYHRIYDHCLANWLNQAGVSTEYVRLEEVGLPGNGHQMMLELNSKGIAEYISGWLHENVK
ncbi:MAG: alpha/beta hydrolase [Arenicellaceae bacterium]|nr:alpha/beta hydrolase [Arenicellaceae bacterium]